MSCVVVIATPGREIVRLPASGRTRPRGSSGARPAWPRSSREGLRESTLWRGGRRRTRAGRSASRASTSRAGVLGHVVALLDGGVLGRRGIRHAVERLGDRGVLI